MNRTEPVPVGSVLCIAGPCVIESHELTLHIAETLRDVAERLQLPLIFKASFDKANRTSGKSSSRKELGPSDRALSGSGWTSRNRASHPAATAARARVGIISR